MKKTLIILLTFIFLLQMTSPLLSVLAEAVNAPITATGGTTVTERKTNREYYSNEKWEAQFPEGTFIFEQSNYTAHEGGDDKDNPEDTYFPINIIRMGALKYRSEVTLNISSFIGVEGGVTLQSDTIMFEAGEDVQTAYVKISNDDFHQGQRFFTISILEASKGQVGVMKSTFGATKNTTDYFDFGIYEGIYDKKIVDDQLTPTAKSTMVYNDNKLYTFWIDDPGELIRPDGKHRLILHYKIEGLDGNILDSGYIDNDGTLDSEVEAFLNQNGEVQVVWASYREGVSIPEDLKDEWNLDSEKQLQLIKHINDNTEIKSTVINSDNEIAPAVIIAGTDDARMDSRMSAATRSDKQVISFVKDSKGQTDSNVQSNIKTVDDAAQKSADDLVNAIYKGIPVHYVSYTAGDGSAKTVALETPANDTYWKVGTKVTQSEVEFIDDDNVMLSFIAETPNGQKGNFSGKDIMLFTQFGETDSSGNITFDKPQLVYTIFDYDDSLEDVFGSKEDVPDEYRSENELYENPILSNLYLELVNVPVSGSGSVTADELTLFFKHNDGIRFIDYDTLVAVKNGESSEKTIRNIGLDVQEFEISVTEDGQLYIIYAAPTEDSFDNALMIKFYSSEEEFWSDPITLTSANAFDREAYNNLGDTGRIEIKNLSSAVLSGAENDNYIKVSAHVDYVPFAYDEILLGEAATGGGNSTDKISVPYLKTDDKRVVVQLIQFAFGKEIPGTVSASELTVEHNIFVTGWDNKASIALTNMGTEVIKDPAVTLKSTSGFSKELNYTCDWIPGQEIKFEFDFTYSNKIRPEDNMYVTVSSELKEIFSSATGENAKVFKIPKAKPELLLQGASVKWNLGPENKNILQYSMNVDNVSATALASSDKVKVHFQLMKQNAETLMYEVDESVGDSAVVNGVIESGMIGSHEVSADDIENKNSDILYNVFGSFEIPTELTGDDFVIRALIDYAGDEYEKSNNISSTMLLYVPISITTGYEDSGNILSAVVGDEIVLDELNIESTSDSFTRADIELFEVDSDYLSIQNDGGNPKIKIMRSADDGIVTAKVTAQVRGTQVSKSIYINLSRTKIINLTDKAVGSGVTVSAKLDSKDSKMKMVTGEDLVPYGFDESSLVDKDLLTNEPTLIANSALEISVKVTKVENATRLRLFMTGTKPKNISVKADGLTIPFTANTWNKNNLLASSCVLEIPLDGTKTYNEITIMLSPETKQQVFLDYIALDGFAEDLPDDEYPVSKLSNALLDAPTQSDRLRRGEISLDLSKPVTVNPAKSKEFALKYEVYKVTGDVSKKIDDVEFKFETISKDGKTLTFANDNLTSEYGSDIVYKLANDMINNAGSDANAFLFKHGTKTNVGVINVTNFKELAFTLKESKISSVEVVHDADAPGELKKSVCVTFEKAVNADRLKNTKIAYTDADGAEVIFTYSGMMTSSTTKAIYRAELNFNGQNSLKYTFKEGIILDMSYALMSKDNHYISHIIDADIGKPEIAYALPVAEKVTLERVFLDNNILKGEKLQSKITFNKDVVLGDNGKAVIRVKITETDTGGIDKDKEILLSSVSVINGKTVIFETSDIMTYVSNDTVTLSVVSAKIENASSTGVILDKEMKHGIDLSIAPALLPPPVTFSAQAQILSAALGLKDGFKENGTVPTVKVDFSSNVMLSTLKGSTISVREENTLSDGTVTEKERTLTFAKMIESGPLKSVMSSALYEYTDSESIDFTPDSETKNFRFNDNPLIETVEGKNILNDLGNVRIYPQILTTTAEDIAYDKIQIEDVQLLRRNVTDGEGNEILLKIQYSDDVVIENLADIKVALSKTSSLSTDPINLEMVGTEYDTETRILTLSVIDDIYENCENISYLLESNLTGSVLDVNRISASINLVGKSDLQFENVTNMIDTVEFDLSAVSLANPVPLLKIKYPVAALADCEITVRKIISPYFRKNEMLLSKITTCRFY